MHIFCWDIIPQPSDFIHLHHPSSLIPQPSSIFHLPSSISHLLILILPPIPFRHFQKFSKLLHPLWFHLSSIQGFTIRLEPVEHIMLLYPMLRGISMICLNVALHLIIPRHPLIALGHNYSFII